MGRASDKRPATSKTEIHFWQYARRVQCRRVMNYLNVVRSWRFRRHRRERVVIIIIIFIFHYKT